VLYVTQDYKEAMALADRIAVLAGGKFVQLASPEDVYLRPATLNVAKLFGDPSINTVETEVLVSGKQVHVNIHGAGVTVPTALAFHAGRKVVFAVRPEAVVLSEKGEGLECSVTAVTPLNERVVLLLNSVGGWEILASLPSSANVPPPGTALKAMFEPSGTHLFDQATGERLNG
jgi:multiple sugar transport system ATP-binding protein